MRGDIFPGLLVEAAEFAVEGGFALGEEGDFGPVGAAFGFGDLGAELALVVLDAADLKAVDGAEDFSDGWGIVFSHEGLGEEGELVGILDGGHGVKACI